MLGFEKKKVKSWPWIPNEGVSVFASLEFYYSIPLLLFGGKIYMDDICLVGHALL